MMNKRTGYTASKRWEPFMVGVVLFLVVVVGVNMLFAYLSVRSWTGMVTSDPYTKGLRFNRRIQAQQAQEALGWRSRCRPTWRPDGQAPWWFRWWMPSAIL